MWVLTIVTPYAFACKRWKRSLDHCCMLAVRVQFSSAKGSKIRAHVAIYSLDWAADRCREERKKTHNDYSLHHYDRQRSDVLQVQVTWLIYPPTSVPPNTRPH